MSHLAYHGLPLQLIEQYFQHFGALCEVLDISQMKAQGIIMKMISQYCTELVEIKLTGPVLSKPNELEPFFSKLRRIDISYAEIADFLDIFDYQLSSPSYFFILSIIIGIHQITKTGIL